MIRNVSGKVAAGLVSLLVGTIGAQSVNAALNASERDYELKLLGKYVFFDESLSNPETMACATCHAPSAGGTSPFEQVNRFGVVMPGADQNSTGGLKPPTNAYATFIEPFGVCGKGATGYCGGNFWNGRSVGRFGEVQSFSTTVIGVDVIPAGKESYRMYLKPAADQAMNPFLNPVEHNMTEQSICNKVAAASYSPLYTEAWGEPIDCGVNLEESYQRIAVSLAAYQHSRDINSFSSKYDRALRRERNGIDVDSTPGEFPLVRFTNQENLGRDLFYGVTSTLNPQGKDARCAVCHTDNEGDSGAEQRQLFTDDSFHNIGMPFNSAIVNPESVGTEGLIGHLGSSNFRGYRKTPTLRNVDKRPTDNFIKAYGSNGWFKSLESIVHFYNTADTRSPEDHLAGIGGRQGVKLHSVTECPAWVRREAQALARNCWPTAEFRRGAVRGRDIGNLGLTDAEEAAIVAFLKTMTDSQTAEPPAPYQP